MRNINPNIFPKDGFWFKEKDGSRHYADTWVGVIKRVRLYRKRAGYPEGNPEVEVIEQACERNPNLCVESNGAAQAQVQMASLKSRVLQRMNWLSQEKEKNQLAFVEVNEARQRADICAGCPKNIAIPEGCSSCKAALKAIRDRVIGSRFVDGRLTSCGALGTDLPTEIHLDQVRIDNRELPGNCWRRTAL